MTKAEKALDKLKAKPTPASIKWSELCTALGHLGYEIVNGTGSRRKFYNKERDLLINCHEPHPSPDVDKGAIADVVGHLRENGLLDD